MSSSSLKKLNLTMGKPTVTLKSGREKKLKNTKKNAKGVKHDRRKNVGNNSDIDMSTEWSIPTVEMKIQDHNAKLVRALLEWYDLEHRDLPWRRTPYSKKRKITEVKVKGHGSNEGNENVNIDSNHDQQQFAYMVWVSEMMLQQTQVSRVEEYFVRWMNRWPTLEAFATNAREEVRHRYNIDSKWVSECHGKSLFLSEFRLKVSEQMPLLA